MTAIGGVFLRSADPDRLGRWYAQHLGVDMPPGNYEEPAWVQRAGPTVWAIFDSESDMFGRADQQWMINFRVRDLDAMVHQLRAADRAVEVDPEDCPNGRFARLADPDGNPIQLWQPR